MQHCRHRGLRSMQRRQECARGPLLTRHRARVESLADQILLNLTREGRQAQLGVGRQFLISRSRGAC
jgi:hypothetical protein